MKEIRKLMDKFFKDVFKRDNNAATLLKKLLPDEIRSRVDFSTLKPGSTNYISKTYDEFFSDIVFNAEMTGKAGKSGKPIITDICFILEHKTEARKKIFVQFLKYMYHQWQQDVDNGRAPRPIIPIVFYHGKEEWNVPDEFVDLFEVEDPVKPFLLNYSYILFDTQDWDFRTETDPELRENVFLLSAMALMKYTYDKNIDAIEEIIRFWKRNGFIHDRENVIFFLIYISQTYDIEDKQMLEIFDRNSIIEGGEIMQTLAERLIGNTREETERKVNLKTARKLIKDRVDINIIMNATGLSKEEVEKLAETIH